MEKPFLTIEKQVELLESRGVTTDEDTPRILLAEGYYSIVNGYKAPFLDEEATRAAGEDRYLKGTRFSDLYALFSFDRELRETTFHYLIRIEAMVKTVCSHTFSEAHRGYADYLDQSNFSDESEYASLGLENHADDLGKLIGKLRSRSDRSEREPIVHYRNDYGGVPLWVLTNDLTFGIMEHFFNLMKPKEQRDVCKRICEVTGRLGSKSLGYFSPLEARACLDTLVKARNICAHDERLYCARIGDRKRDTYATIQKRMRRFMSEAEFRSMLMRVGVLIKDYSRPEGTVGHVIEQMGLRDA